MDLGSDLRMAVALALAAAMGAGPAAVPVAADDSAADAPGGREPTRRPLEVRPGALRGKLVDIDGATPIPGARVRVRDDGGRVVAEATSDASGDFDAGELEPGSYRIEIGCSEAILRVAPEARAVALLLAIPTGLALALRGEGGAPGAAVGAVFQEGAGAGDGTVLGLPKPVAIGVGVVLGGGAVAGGTIAIVEAQEGGGGGGFTPILVPPRPSPTVQ